MAAMRRTLVLVLAALGATGCGGEERREPLRERAWPAAGVVVRDPSGSIDLIAAGGHQVAWTVRTPPDRLEPPEDAEGPPPYRWPRSTRLVVADERTGRTRDLDLGIGWVSRLRVFRGPRDEPLAAFRRCPQRRDRCTNAVVALGARLRIDADADPRAAQAAADGRRDRGRTLAASGRACDATLTVDGRRLPRLPAVGDRCLALTPLAVVGRHVLVSRLTEERRLRFEHENVFALDLEAPSPRWRAVANPYNASGGSTGLAAGPAITDEALVYELLDDGAWRLDRVALRDGARTVAAPIEPGSPDACDLVATDAALYELASSRCAWDPSQTGGAVIRRTTAPRWRRPGPEE